MNWNLETERSSIDWLAGLTWPSSRMGALGFPCLQATEAPSWNPAAARPDSRMCEVQALAPGRKHVQPETGSESRKRFHFATAFSLALPKEKAWQKERLVVWERGDNEIKKRQRRLDFAHSRSVRDTQFKSLDDGWR
jgi:hypothetical protein